MSTPPDNFMMTPDSAQVARRLKSHTICHLEDGTYRRYDVCDPERDIYNSKVFKYIGAGTIFSVNGVQQVGGERLHFFVYREE